MPAFLCWVAFLQFSFLTRKSERSNLSRFRWRIYRAALQLGMKTIAEFAATPEIVEMLRDMGVDYAQGYATGAPKPFPGVHASPAANEAAEAAAPAAGARLGSPAPNLPLSMARGVI